jgi:hypothetical protein
MPRCSAVNLRGEAAKFVLSALALNSHPENTAGQFQAFLRAEPTLRWSLSANRHTARPRPNRHADLAVAEFAADGSLRSLQSMLDERRVDAPLLWHAGAELVRAYNRSRHDDDVERLERIWSEWTTGTTQHAPWPAGSHEQAMRYARRLLTATWLSFESTDARFTAPDFFLRKHGGLGALNVVARPQPNGAVDLWVQVHPAAIDAAPMQEALARLASQWGRKEPVMFPAPQPLGPPRIAGVVHSRTVERTQDLIDFSPLLALRKSLNIRLDTALTGKVHLSALLIWCLARQPEFDGRAFSLGVDLPAEGRHRRGFTYLTVCPSDYFTGPHGLRLSAYVREFNRLLSQTRRRKGDLYRGLTRAALLPAPLRARYMATFPGSVAFFGVNLLRDAELCLSPMPDRGFDGGMLAVGNMNLARIDGKRVGCASFAGPACQIANCPTALRRAIENCASLV